jgi:hypothetical protein
MQLTALRAAADADGVRRLAPNLQIAGNTQRKDMMVSADPKRSPLEILFRTPVGGRSFSIVVALLPFISFAFLFIVNPAYMSNFFLPDVRPIGLSMLGLVVLLSLVSYALLRCCWSIIESGRRLQGVLLAMLVMVLVAFQLLLVLLGPAALALLDANL